MSYDHESYHGTHRRPLPALEVLTIGVVSVLILAGTVLVSMVVMYSW